MIIDPITIDGKTVDNVLNMKLKFLYKKEYFGSKSKLTVTGYNLRISYDASLPATFTNWYSLLNRLCDVKVTGTDNGVTKIILDKQMSLDRVLSHCTTNTLVLETDKP
jgi:hypothetical protein